jgi:aldose sugar dehydrogenase
LAASGPVRRSGGIRGNLARDGRDRGHDSFARQTKGPFSEVTARAANICAMKRTLAPVALALTAVTCAGAAQNSGGYVDSRGANAPHQSPAFAGQYRAPRREANVAFDVVTVAKGLDSPWGLAFLPDGRMLVTEQPGRLRILASDGSLSAPLAGVPPVDARGQGGLLGVAVDPGFATNHLIYWSYSEPRGNGRNNTAVARGALVDSVAPRVDQPQVIFHQSPSIGSRGHFGGRLVWARDGTLFVTLGDRQVTEGRMQAQRLDGLLGKVVRINSDGTVPADNPFVGKTGVRPEIWSYGHRNIQAAALHPATGELWESEHGTRGGDEVNVARKGLDYGWPTIAYGIEYGGSPITGNVTAKAGMEQPRYYWDPNIAPSGMTFYTGRLFPAWQNSLFIGALAGESLVRLTLEGDRIVGEERLLGDLGERIRDVVQGPDGALYLLTDDSNGRVLKIVPKAK